MFRDMLSYTEFDHDEYARSRPRTDFWGQIRRTVNGISVNEDQIELIVDAINKRMKLKKNDTVLDICCGNGALSSRISKNITNLIGVDNSEYLVSVGKEYFEKIPTIVFHKSEIIDFLQSQSQIEKANINKILCYGSISYLDSTAVIQIFNEISINYKSVTHFFIGNIPDKSKSKCFFAQNKPTELDLNSHTTSIGKWWEKEEIKNIAKIYSWECHITTMPNNFYGSSYRFDAILTRELFTHE